MAKIILRDVLYTPFEDVFDNRTIAQHHKTIKDVLQSHISKIGEQSNHSYHDASHHYFCSTMMDSVFSAGSIDTTQIVPDLGDVTQSFSNAYECACWGYLLREHLVNKPNQRYLAISILDVNAMEMKYWSSNEQWGKSGFGITTLFIEIEAPYEAESLMHNGVAAGGNNIISFASFANQVAKRCQASTLSLPFFPDSMSIPVRRSLKNVHVLTERHSEYGHAFGSDPWIGFIRDYKQDKVCSSRIVFGSLALRGYYCFADITLADNIQAQQFEAVA